MQKYLKANSVFLRASYSFDFNQSLHHLQHFHFVCSDCTAFAFFNRTVQSTTDCATTMLAIYLSLNLKLLGLGVSNFISQSALLGASSRHRQEETVIGNHKAGWREKRLSSVSVSLRAAGGRLVATGGMR